MEKKMNFGKAIEEMKSGSLVRRAGWNGKGMHIYLESAFTFVVPTGELKGETRTHEAHFVMFTAQGKHQPGWLASQADMLAEDWEIVPAMAKTD